MRPKVDCRLVRKNDPKAGWLARAESAVGSVARASYSAHELKIRGASPTSGKSNRTANGKVARAERAQNKQSVADSGVGGVDPSTQPGGKLWKYLHMQSRPQGQPAGTRGGQDPRPQDARVMAASDGNVPRLCEFARICL